MDRIKGLPDDLLLKILSFLPTKVAVSTCILSKRWEFLWMWLPKLEYEIRNFPGDAKKLRCFVNRTLPLHRAPIIESFRIRINFNVLQKSEDITQWVEVALSRHLRELNIYSRAYSDDDEKLLPSSLYACKTLVVLKLSCRIHLDVSRMVSLPSLKTLQLQYLISLDGKALLRLLSICPVLENLWVGFDYSSTPGNISINVPSLQKLSLCIKNERDGLRIAAPSLKYLKLEDRNKEDNYISIENMPKLEEAYINVTYYDIKSIIGSITSVKRLTLRCPKIESCNSFVFNQLEHLELCSCTDCLTKFLAKLLKGSPKLRVLDFLQMGGNNDRAMFSWNEPSIVPECLMSSLQTFNWFDCLGRPQNRDVAAYILKNASRLKTVRISIYKPLDQEKIQMIKELSSSSRASPMCQLIFD